MVSSSKVVSFWHEARIPVILGATFCYVYWRLCFYQPRATIPKKLTNKKDQSLENGNHNDDKLEVDYNEQSSTNDASSDDQDGEVVVISSNAVPIRHKKSRKAKVFTRRVTVKPGLSGDVYIFYSTLTGTTEKFAKRLEHEIQNNFANRKVSKINIDYIDDLDTYFVNPSKELDQVIYLFVVPSYASESPLDYFIETLKDTYNDFRVDSKPLRKLGGYAVFGTGDKESWEEAFCYQALLIDKYIGKLGAPRAFPVGTGDVKSNASAEFDEWIEHLSKTLADPESVAHQVVDASESEDDEDEQEQQANGEDEVDINKKEKKVAQKKDGVVDVEDMGVIMANSQKKEMVGKDSPTYAALTKQGYTIVGSHSGVKICRWTKSALRGRGSCYKFAFYGIKSHLCMETTPSLSCSNKCVFCWRHGTNPVGTTWRWQVDPPDQILKGAMEGHYKKIKQMRGVPGVQAARFAEAFTIRHCALSLVGEPIFYPHINEFVGMLHDRKISSFLVCNAQHPDQLRKMSQVTQLYVSIDASDKESLRRIDKPLHRDFWERFNECLDILRTKQTQRTVFRLTLVKGFNLNEAAGYARLVDQARPCFIEIKGVTYCGTSTSGKEELTMANVPFYDEVKDFVTALNTELQALGLDYQIAAEHAHSCCILIAQSKFYINGEWYTHIDYDRFFELQASGAEFGPMDYIAKTPDWAVYGSSEAGFNPEDERVTRRAKVAVAAAA
ncbi:hypothetical protein V1514DRAFT_319103 [Lipomyces japonicus]|uniref:uncharacterized protein n=1 Tax=Lipomyces japonicus TaxID=56871 RepID=UPI0034CD88EE